MFFVEARKYLMKLIRLQKSIKRKGYTRADQREVDEALSFIDQQLHFFQYASDEKMRGFFDRHRQQIKMIIPGEDYPGFKKLMNEFINLQNQ